MASERKFIVENIRRILLKEHVRKATERAGFGGVDVQRTPVGTRITLTAERPGMVIGHKGSTIKELTSNIETLFEFDNPKIEVQEDNEPGLNPTIMAQKLASALERGWHFRRAGHSTVRRIMDSGARGCQVVIAGKLTGERHRTEKFKQGHIKYCGEPKNQFMRIGYAVAKRKPGITGIKVMIMDPKAKLPDEITVNPQPEQVKETLEEVMEKVKKKDRTVPVSPDDIKEEEETITEDEEGEEEEDDDKADPKDKKSKRARKKEEGERKKEEAKKLTEERKKRKEEAKRLSEEEKRKADAAAAEAKRKEEERKAEEALMGKKEDEGPLPKPIDTGKDE